MTRPTLVLAFVLFAPAIARAHPPSLDPIVSVGLGTARSALLVPERVPHYGSPYERDRFQFERGPHGPFGSLTLFVGHDVLRDANVRIALGYRGEADVGLLDLDRRQMLLLHRHGAGLELRASFGLFASFGVAATFGHLPLTGSVIAGGSVSTSLGWAFGPVFVAFRTGLDLMWGMNSHVFLSQPYGVVIGLTSL